MSAPQIWLSVAAIYGAAGVVCGAFGAHALRARLAPDLLAVWHTAVEYQLFHALALIAVAILMWVRPMPWLGVAAACFALGVLVFSGSLYLLVLSSVRVLGAVTPIGGVLLIAGWIALLVSAIRS
ncbi:MAG: DUF423 domain-containing protein [Nevskiaceae bacterium]|nr:MAG: DUF423 domain-containing protein [Nevskiaceae bacterium]TBR75082.1 MAG: DUF423 domain-containing protein [Nevskiaceae bacterium]